MPGWTPEDDANLAKAMGERVAAARAADAAASAPPAKAGKGGAPDAAAANPSDNDQPEQTDSVSSDAAGATDKGGTPPPAAPTTFDTLFLPERSRSKVHFDDDQAYADVRAAVDGGRAAATQKFQDASALRRDAENYRALIGDPDLAAVIVQAKADKLAGRSPAFPASGAPPRELDPLDPKSVEEHIARTVAEGVAQPIRELREELSRPAKLKAAVNEALGDFATANGVDVATMQAAVRLADARLIETGKKWHPDLVDVLMPSYVELARAKQAPATPPPASGASKTTPPTNGHAGTDEVASPTGRGGAHQAHVIPLPRHFVNGKPPQRPRSSTEYEDEMLYAMRKRYGPDVTIEDVRAGMATR